MAVDAIGNVLNTTNTVSTNSVLNQQDFLKLFLTELTYQDPLEPLNNRDFLEQMAQFANLEQTRQTTDSVNNLVYLNSSSQSVSLLGKQVQLPNAAGTINGIVSAITFGEDGLSLDVTESNGNVIKGVLLSQIGLIRN